MKDNFFEGLSKDENFIIDLIKKACENLNKNVYVVGGSVRDIILNEKIRDIDICVEENPIEIINNIKEYIAEYDYHEKFQTSTIKFKNKVIIDLIRCRKEIYDHNGALPEIIPSNIEDDLYRRDFTINALAYDLRKNKIIDLFSGINDIKSKVIRKIHNNSYDEDPTRIFRAIKYKERYGFKLYDVEEINQCICNDGFSYISKDRFIKEIYSMCDEYNWNNIIKCLFEFHILNGDLDIIGYENLLVHNYNDNNIKLLNLFLAVYDKGIFINNSVLPKEVRDAFKFYKKRSCKILRVLSEKNTNYDIYEILKYTTYYERVIFCWYNDIKYKILNYEYNLQHISLNINGDFVEKLGINDGKLIGDILKYIREIKFNVGIINEDEYLTTNLGEILNDITHKDR